MTIVFLILLAAVILIFGPYVALLVIAPLGIAWVVLYCIVNRKEEKARRYLWNKARRTP